MKNIEKWLPLLICPECKGNLKYINLDDSTLNGLLICVRNHYYPVFNNVPVLIKNNCLPLFLTKDELQKLWQYLQKLKINFHKKISLNEQIKNLRESNKNWSVQWDKYKLENSIWEDKNIFLEHIPIDLSCLEKYKFILEIGCGNGRNIKHLITKENIIFALDISNSVYSVRKRYKTDDNVFVIRCNAQYLPFEDSSFDFIYADHVLQHIGNLQQCFYEIKRVAKRKNIFIFNLYSKENNFLMTKFIEPFKKIILNKLSLKFIHILSNLPTILLWLIIKLIYLPLYKFSQKFYYKLPLAEHITFWFSFSYEILKQACFDLLHAPIANYFNSTDIKQLCANTDLKLTYKHLLRQTLWVCKGSFKKNS